ncbi:MAG: sterol desaturase family protein [Sphingomonadales bacterium]|nr:sterol desaturase family protein [Sphingomonadales bacterium]
MFAFLHTDTGLMKLWLALFLGVALVTGIATGFFKARKIQPNGFKWRIFRNEIVFAVLNVVVTGFLLGPLTHVLTKYGYITFKHDPAAWYVVAGEYALYFFGFDTWFYWLHRWMHKGTPYRLIHLLHHKSTSPNVVTTFSVNPLESVVNGGFVPLFTALMSVHDTTMALIVPTNVIMGIYVHTGYEFLPRWFNATWFTKWFITTSFHDQHHKTFNWNFGGYTTIWDRLCGTVHKHYDRDFAYTGGTRNPDRDA